MCGSPCSRAGNMGADSGERALSHNVPHSQATSQRPLGLPGPGMGTTDPLPPSTGPAGLCVENRVHLSVSSLCPTPTSLQRKPGLWGQSCVAFSGTQRCEVFQMPSIGLWWSHPPITLSISEDLMASSYCPLKVVPIPHPKGNVEVEGPGRGAGRGAAPLPP